ncbi:nitrous oxide reductase accessory protein NosL [Natronospira bacteriovora]|uniref:Nitrous oxide reductase accessory protein NosL n=1 Tax=Natronospira bacteriovora TaxID=3069753 RepID=A0ABU0W903_9GAMM|nr:nitrous oxide reductase accessory protein NosL [Natronospira sp. AB-CW4]MDQ2070388.1 nitrous oxide reductase accessory protein NosL [Natronospira sp. AB-CW4]
MGSRRDALILLAGLPALMLMACGDGREAAANCKAVTLSDEHDCALCGMTVVRHPGPKGQACLRNGDILPFCSTSDLLSWAWQPESGPAIEALFVHDLSRTDWESPSDETYVLAGDAWYVAGHQRRGAMGYPPAPFTERADAEAFAEQHGGRVYTFNDLSFDIIRGR